MKAQIITGDCVEVMKGMAENSIDAIVTDPPYHLTTGKTGSTGFMGKDWDGGGIAFDPATWREALRLLKPGGYLLAFGGSRTYHRLTCAIEDAGFEVRDCLMWVHGQGFPKNLDVSKQLDKHQGKKPTATGEFKRASIQRNGIGENWNKGAFGSHPEYTKHVEITAPVTDEAKRFDGFGTALKPSFEPLVYAQKPLLDKALYDKIGSILSSLEAKLWLLSYVNVAEPSSTSSRADLETALSIARWTVADAINTRGALCDLMDTSQLRLAISTSLSIVSSWLRTLDEFLESASTFTIGTESSTTIDWSTLRYSLSRITAESIVLSQIEASGFPVSVKHAMLYSSAALLKLKGILALSAIESAISKDRIDFRDAAEQVKTEPIVLARKPLAKGLTIAANVLEYGTGGLNIGACRVPGDESTVRPINNIRVHGGPDGAYVGQAGHRPCNGLMGGSDLGRWPANISTDGSEQVLAAFPQTTGGDIKPYERQRRQGNAYGLQPAINTCERKGDSGSAARFFAQFPPDDLNGDSRIFYTAKASQSDRNSGLQGERNPHNTVKPQSLCRYLCKLICPPGGTVLDMFAGSGSTGKAAIMEGFDFIGIEQDPAMSEIARHRTTGAAPLFVEMTSEAA